MGALFVWNDPRGCDRSGSSAASIPESLPCGINIANEFLGFLLTPDVFH